jgi:hypothetical protein
MTTAQQSSQQQLTAPHRSFDRSTALAGRIIGNHALVLLKLVSSDEALVLILDFNRVFVGSISLFRVGFARCGCRRRSAVSRSCAADNAG